MIRESPSKRQPDRGILDGGSADPLQQGREQPLAAELQTPRPRPSRLQPGAASASSRSCYQSKAVSVAAPPTIRTRSRSSRHSSSSSHRKVSSACSAVAAGSRASLAPVGWRGSSSGAVAVAERPARRPATVGGKKDTPAQGASQRAASISATRSCMAILAAIAAIAMKKFMGGPWAAGGAGAGRRREPAERWNHRRRLAAEAGQQRAGTGTSRPRGAGMPKVTSHTEAPQRAAATSRVPIPRTPARLEPDGQEAGRGRPRPASLPVVVPGASSRGLGPG